MPNSRNWGTALFLLTTISGPVHGDVTTDARKAIQENYNKINSALAKKDLVTVFTIYDPNFQSVSPAGHREKLATYRQGMPSTLKMTRTYRATTTVQKITVSGNLATVLIRDHTEMTMAIPHSKKVSKIVIDAKAEDLWERTGGRWLRKLNRTISAQSNQDGRVMKER